MGETLCVILVGRSETASVWGATDIELPDFEGREETVLGVGVCNSKILFDSTGGSLYYFMVQTQNTIHMAAMIHPDIPVENSIPESNLVQ